MEGWIDEMMGRRELRLKRGSGMGSTIFQRRAEPNWAEMEGSMMSRVLKREEPAEERRCSVESC